MIVIGFDGWAARRGAQWGILSRFCVYYSKVIYIEVEILCHVSKFLLRKCLLLIILFHLQMPQVSHFSPWVQRKKREMDNGETGWNRTFAFLPEEPQNIRQKMNLRDYPMQLSGFRRNVY